MKKNKQFKNIPWPLTAFYTKKYTYQMQNQDFITKK